MHVTAQTLYLHVYLRYISLYTGMIMWCALFSVSLWGAYITVGKTRPVVILYRSCVILGTASLLTDLRG